MAGTDGAEVPDGSEPVNEVRTAGTEAAAEPEPELDETPEEGDLEEAPETRKAPPPAPYGGLRVRAVGAAPSKSSGEVRPSPGPSPSAWS